MTQRPDLYRLGRRERFWLLAALYFSQGLPFGLFVQAVPVLLREEGVSLEAIGFSALLALPWALKFLWAPLVDSVPGVDRGGRRKAWIVPLQMATALLFGLLALTGLYANLVVLLGSVFLINLFNATQDIATDGLAVDILPPEERGLGNSLQVGGYRVGMVVGGAGLLLLIEHAGWTVALLVAAVIMVTALGPLLIVREPARRARGAARTAPRGWRLMWSFFRRPWAWLVVLLAAIWKFGDAFAGGMVRPLLVDQGYSMGDIGLILGAMGFTAGLFGAVVGGVLVDRFSRLQALVGAALIQTAGVAVYLPLVLGSPSAAQVYGIVAIDHLNGGVATVVLFACMMDWARPSSAGTDYTLLASVVVLSSGIAQGLSGLSAGALGYGVHFTLATVLTAAGGLGAVALFVFARRMEPGLEPLRQR